LTSPPHARHDSVVPRVLCFVLACVLTLWLPARFALVAERVPGALPADGSAQTGQPSPAPDFGPRIIAGPTGTWQARVAHDALAAVVCPRRLHLLPVSLSIAAPSPRLHAPPTRFAFPLLI
jgi:hypothetical protein